MMENSTILFSTFSLLTPSPPRKYSINTHLNAKKWSNNMILMGKTVSLNYRMHFIFFSTLLYPSPPVSTQIWQNIACAPTLNVDYEKKKTKN